MTGTAFRHSIACMETPCESLFKRREIVFSTLHPDPDQPGSAAAMLLEIEEIEQVMVLDNGTVQVHYHLAKICLADIEGLLEAKGFHLENGLVQKIKRALFHYTEETQLANLGCEHGDPDCIKKVFVNCYRSRNHGCQDDRPDHWRRYL